MCTDGAGALRRAHCRQVSGPESDSAAEQQLAFHPQSSLVRLLVFVRLRVRLGVSFRVQPVLKKRAHARASIAYGYPYPTHSLKYSISTYLFHKSFVLFIAVFIALAFLNSIKTFLLSCTAKMRVNLILVRFFHEEISCTFCNSSYLWCGYVFLSDCFVSCAMHNTQNTVHNTR